MKRIQYLIFAIFIVIIAFSGCSHKPVRILPQGNIDLLRGKDSINTPKNEIAPYIRVKEYYCQDAYFKEIKSDKYLLPSTDEIKPSSSFFEEILDINFTKNNKQIIDYLTNQLESVSFLTFQSGVVSISHPFDENFNKIKNLPFTGSVGGTDLFFFSNETQPMFQVLPEPINSEFWDSHPWIGQDSLCNLVLIWASDRDYPYSKTKSITNQTITSGNIDLFYAFRINGKWSQPKKFSTDSEVNTNNYNEVSPFVACSGIAPKLLFSSNRNGDYDIFIADIEFDFTNQTIYVKSQAKMFDKGSQYDFENTWVNTEANEIFPFVAFPYTSNSNKKQLFLASNRNIFEKPKNEKKDTLVINKGKFDIYAFNIDLECKIPPPPPPPPPPPIPKVTLKVILKDTTNNEVIKPVIELIDNETQKKVDLNTSTGTFDLELNKLYKVRGGSYLNYFDCDNPNNCFPIFYKGKNYKAQEPKITSRKVKIYYDTVINPNLVVQYDTTYKKEIVVVNKENILNPKTSQSKKIKDTLEQKVTQSETTKDFNIIRCPPRDQLEIFKKQNQNIEIDSTIDQIIESRPVLAEVTKEVITKREWFEGGKTIKKYYEVIEYDTTFLPPTTILVDTVFGPVISSFKTRTGYISTYNIKGDLTIYDTIVLTPVLFCKPPCIVAFDSIQREYYKNVPYYQTAFWKVNTSVGLEQHLLDMQEGGYLENASFIELSPKNRDYGIGHPGREKRKAMYRQYAKEVDKNLLAMRDTVTEVFIPSLEKLLEYSPESKLLLKLEAYSDIRDASKCYYIGNTVNYIQGYEQNNEIVLSKVEINSGDVLGSDNDNLSKLRVYFGFKELFQRLRNNKKFNEYFNKGLVFYPTQEFKDDKDMLEALKKAKIIIIAEGKYYDKVVKTNEIDYDPVRRLNLFIKPIQYMNMRIIPSKCCR